MDNKKLIYVWVIMFILAIIIIKSIITIGTYLIHISMFFIPGILTNPPLLILELSLMMIGVIISLIYFVNLYHISKATFIWTHIVFGYYFLSYLLSKLLDFFHIGIFVADHQEITLLVYIAVTWATFYFYLKKYFSSAPKY